MNATIIPLATTSPLYCLRQRLGRAACAYHSLAAFAAVYFRHIVFHIFAFVSTVFLFASQR
jgi:hypothetical protein